MLEEVMNNFLNSLSPSDLQMNFQEFLNKYPEKLKNITDLWRINILLYIKSIF